MNDSLHSVSSRSGSDGIAGRATSPAELGHVLHCFAEQRFLGPELAEDRDLVDASCVGDTAGG